jgi:DsbC/DsbD-like thiol-disulfide interchange protein/cytochrome c biogenesis protein CcdA/thiol-disulfide isomerase/thioredoxin
MIPLRLILICVFAFAGFRISAQEHDGVELTKREMLADASVVEPGKTFYVGFKFKIADHWHLYWRFAGSLGYPITPEWTLPKGWTAGDVEFPLPVAVNDPLGQTLFVYEHEVLFPVKITPAKNAAPGPVKITAKLRWQICQEICKEGESVESLQLTVGPKAAPANAELFSKWLAQLPQSGEPPTKDIKFEMTGKVLSVRVGGLPAEVKAEFFPIPPVYDGYISTDETAKTSATKSADGVHLFSYPMSSEMPWSGLLVVTGAGGIRKGWEIGEIPPATAPPGSGKSAPVAEVVEDDGETWDPFDDIAKGEAGKPANTGLLSLLLQGLLGGLILNLMPCVLPVISVKIIGFVQQAQESRSRVFRLGLAYCGGVFAFFFALAVLVLILSSTGKSLGWGGQFSNPILLTVMVAILVVMALSLLGIFEITLPGGASTALSDAAGKHGMSGAFLHGFLTTLLGTSCSAPFVAPVIGAALNEPGIRIFALFGAIATGLALPYFLLTWQPAWMKFVPKPGMWMIRFKQVCGFVMLGFGVWLLGSLPTTIMLVAVASFLLVVSFACWVFGTYHEARWRWPVMILIIAGGWWLLVHGTVEPPVEKPSGLLVKIRKGLNENRPVFVDFTADWCANCKAFEKAYLNTPDMQAAMAAKNVLFIKADYTYRPPDISEALKKCGRAAVPVYVLFRKRGDYWMADTPRELLAEINKLP